MPAAESANIFLLPVDPLNANLATTDSILKLLNREIWVVTAAAGDRRGGLCATWVSAASINAERPVMLIGLAPNHFTAELVEQSKAFTLHLLRPYQTAVALNFASSSGRERDKLAGLDVTTGSNGSPRLTDCLAWLECKVFARYDAGDRWFYWADVIESAKLGDGPPLREQELIAAATPEQRQALLADRHQDAALQAPLHEAWRLRNQMGPG